MSGGRADMQPSETTQTFTSEAAEAVAKSFYEAHGTEGWAKLDETHRGAYTHWMREALNEAAPLFLAEVVSLRGRLTAATELAEEAIQRDDAMPFRNFDGTRTPSANVDGYGLLAALGIERQPKTMAELTVPLTDAELADLRAQLGGAQ